jgi:hypothetical protein
VGTMKEEWRQVVEFPNYVVSNLGLIVNEATGRHMSHIVNQRGIPYVSFNRRGCRYPRSISVLVASAFVTTARSLSFDTPINLDGNRLNNRADNLLWRPRWYAREYFQQFRSCPETITNPVQEVKSEEIFDTSWEAAIWYGLLNREVVHSIVNRTYAIPTYQRFRMLK